MSQYRYLTTQQERYLLLSVDTLINTISKGIDKVYQWDLQREVNFLEKVIDNRTYDMCYDAGRLNSIKHLINHIDRYNEKNGISFLGK